MKVTGAGVANRQIADAGDVVSLLACGGNSSFASLLDVGKNQPGTVDRGDETGAREGKRSKAKNIDEERPQTFRSSGQGGALHSPGSPVIANRDLTSWDAESGVRKPEADVDEVNRSELRIETHDDAARMRADSLRTADARGDGSPLPGRIQLPDTNPTPAALPFGLSDPRLSVPSKHVERSSQDAAVSEVIAPVTAGRPRQEGTLSVAESSSAIPDIAQPSIAPIIKSEPSSAAQGQVDSGLAERAAARGTTGPQHEMKLDSKSKDATVGSGDTGEVNIQDANGKPKPVESSQHFVSAVAPNASGHNQDSQRDPHRGSADSKEVEHLDVMPKTARDVSFGAPPSGGSNQGQAPPSNSGRAEAAQQPGADIKGPNATQSMDASPARQLASVVHGDLRVGIHTEAFGRVTIQTSAQGGQLSAQLSLENTKESAALAAHLPGVEQKIVQQHGLSASVRLVGSFAGGAGTGSMARDQTGSGRGDQERYRNEAGMRLSGIDDGASRQSRTPEAGRSGSSYSRSSRLDVVA